MDVAALQRKGYSVAALRALARRRLPRMVFDMVDGAAGDEITMRRNEAALASIELAPKVLAGAPKRDQTVELFGVRLPSPVIIGPMGLAGLLWPHAEPAAARAAARFGAIYTTSHASTSTIEEIGGATSGPKWMQVFLYKDRGITANFAARAAASGYKALVLTVDNQVTAGRDRDVRNGMSFPQGSEQPLRFRNPARLGPAHGADAEPDLRQLRRARLDRRLWAADERATHARDHLERRRLVAQQRRGPTLVKGLLHPDEARESEKRGLDAVIVSNHGGRQLDGAVSSIAALPPIVDALGGSIPVLIDGGFRRGVDVVKALALGARAVLIGRPHLWGVACAGEEGVLWVLELYHREIDRALALGSRDCLAKLDRRVLVDPGSIGARFA
jgi:isopentenyl diphosphate isomerase/L-lactate dehydrogenase-like FMN-dependent dehydrogenase